MRWLAVLCVLGLLSGTACVPQPQAPRSLTVFAAASLTQAFTEMGKAFEQQAGVTVAFNFAGSQQLVQGINEGAPVDVFASANAQQMEAAIDGGRIDPGSAAIFTSNRLVVIVPAENPAELRGLEDLAKPGIKLVLAAQEVPVGRYSLEFLKNASMDGGLGAGYPAAVLANVVSYEESVRGVLAKVSLGEADAGIVYVSDIASQPDSQVTQIAIPEPWNVPAAYPIAVLNDSKAPELANAFVEFVQSAEGQAILARYGFVP